MNEADLDRLNELHADATGLDGTLQAEQRFREAMEAEWPGIYRELTKARERVPCREERSSDEHASPTAFH